MGCGWDDMTRCMQVFACIHSTQGCGCSCLCVVCVYKYICMYVCARVCRFINDEFGRQATFMDSIEEVYKELRSWTSVSY